jgi:hypothetical protein
MIVFGLAAAVLFHINHSPVKLNAKEEEETKGVKGGNNT